MGLTRCYKTEVFLHLYQVYDVGVMVEALPIPGVHQ